MQLFEKLGEDEPEFDIPISEKDLIELLPQKAYNIMG